MDKNKESLKFDEITSSTTIKNKKFKMPKFKSFNKKKNKDIKNNSSYYQPSQDDQELEKNIELNLKISTNEDNDEINLTDNNNESKLNELSTTKTVDGGGGGGGGTNDYGLNGKPAKTDFLLPEEQCDIPSFRNTKSCDPNLIDETRLLLKERYANNPESFYDEDYKRMLEDDWTVTRFLLRRRLDPKRTAKLMEECGRFRKQYKMSEVQLYEFPIEFHKAGGLFKYAPDRVGNSTVYMRVKMYRRVPEISDVFKAFILCVIELADKENDGRGFAVVFDLSGAGLKNVDLGFLSWLLSSFRNYCPKGCSYIIVYNLPWILNATLKLAMSWMSNSNRRALRFVHGDEIENFIAPENLPDYLGGTCKINYREVPKGSKRATEVCDQLDMTREQALKIKEMFKEYLSDDDEDEDNKSSSSENKFNQSESTNSSNTNECDNLKASSSSSPSCSSSEYDDVDEYCTDEDDCSDEDDNIKTNL